MLPSATYIHCDTSNRLIAVINIASHIQIIGKDSNPANNPVYWTDYLYDVGNKLTEMQAFLPNGNLSYATTYQYDSVGRVINVSYQTQSGGSTHNLASNLQYLPFVGLTQLTHGNGVQTQLTHDQDYRLTNWQTTTDSTTLLDRSYAYDQNSNITQIDHLQNPANTRDFDYDLLDRLNQSDDQTGITDWTYDPVGNRLTENTAAATNDYGYVLGSNILADIQNTSATPITTKNYAVDNRGNTTEITEGGSVTTFAYNAANRPETIVKDGVTTRYTYNALGQRTAKIQGANVTHYIYNLNGQLVGEYQNGNALVEYIYIGSQPLAQLRSGNPYYYHNDHLGTPQTLTDQSQSVVWNANYNAFGKAALTTETVENNLRFAGQYYDNESNLHYNWFRYYDPNLGRFTQSDPIGLDDGPNTYLYVRANPLIYIDPDGLISLLVSGMGEGSVGGGGNVQGGIFLTSGGDTGPADVGVFASGGVSAGVRADLGINVTFLSGGRENINGQTVTTTFDIGPLSFSSHINPTSQEWIGLSIGVNTPTPGATVSYNQGTSYSIREWLSDFLGESKAGQGGRYRDPRFNPCDKPFN